jgi:hypothetical protein
MIQKWGAMVGFQKRMSLIVINLVHKLYLLLATVGLDGLMQN